VGGAAVVGSVLRVSGLLDRSRQGVGPDVGRQSEGCPFVGVTPIDARSLGVTPRGARLLGVTTEGARLLLVVCVALWLPG
jgi:hypothetical protein